MPVKCLIDMDGVVANWIKGCCDVHGVDYNLWPIGQHDFPCNLLNVLDEDAAWKNIAMRGEHFWSKLDLIPDAHQLVKICEDRFGKENCAFLTSPPKSIPEAATGKQWWINNHFPQYRRRLLIGACKEFCASPNSILIDDWQVNVDKFRDNRGMAVLLPRPWNILHHQDTVLYLENTFNALFGVMP